METKRTKWTGENWRLKHQGSTCVVCDVDGDRELVMAAYAGEVNRGDINEDVATASLIACAPEMYAMLAKIIKPYGREDVSDDEIERLLAKARGESC